MIKKTELYIENRQVDLFGDEAFLLNFNVADISDISAKAASYSKELDIPATKENNITFSHLFEVSSEGYFNPLTKKTAEVFVDGVCVMKGFFKLNGMTIIDNEYVTYHGVVYEDSVNFVQALGDLELSNLVMPLTGVTYVPTGSTSNIIISQLNGTDYLYTPPTGPLMVPGRKYNVNYGYLTMTGLALGSLQAIDKNIGGNSPWQYTSPIGQTYTNTKVNAFVALQNITVKLTPNITFTTPKRLVWGWYKATPNGSGSYDHHLIQGTSFLGTNVTSITTPTPLAGVNLAAGDGIYLFIQEQWFTIPSGSAPVPPPIYIDASSQITGTATAQATSPTSSLLIDENYILNNINVATGSTNSDICFPLIDYNQTYPYSAVDDPNNTPEFGYQQVKVKFEDLRPAVFVKRIWDEIFKQNGYKYKSKFLDTNADIFKKLIVVGGIEEDEVETLQYKSVLTGSTQYLLGEPKQDLPSSTSSATANYTYKYRAFLLGGKVPSAVGSYWNTVINRPTYTEFLKVDYTDANRTNVSHGFSGLDYGNVLKANVAGKYKIKANLKGISTPVFYGNSVAPNAAQDITYRLVIEVLPGGSFTMDPSSFTAPKKWNQSKTITFKREPLKTDQPFELNFNETLDLQQGDLARVVLYASAEAQKDPNGSISLPYTSRTILDNTGSCYVEYYRCGTFIGYEATSITNMLPRGMKQSEFILNIAKMFNLYFEPDKQDPRTLYIEPRDAYYEDGRVLNWEKKLDYTNPLDISILPHDQAKNFVFKYDDDSSDYYTEQFKKFTTNGLTFGSYKFVSGDEYVSETSEVGPSFVSSYLQTIAGTNPSIAYTGITANPMVITKIIDPDSQKPEYTGKASKWIKEPRILIYGGKIQLPPYQYRTYQLVFIGNEPDGDEYKMDMPHYPYAGHLDNPIQPKVDINYYTDIKYLETTYWKNGFGNAYNYSISTTTIDLSQVTINGGLVVTIPYNPTNYYQVNANVDKYVKVVDLNNPNNYVIGRIYSSGATTLNLRVTQKNGTGIISSWKVYMYDIQMKYNLFNVYYKQQMIELTDQSSRLMTCKVHLTPVDIANFRFNDVIYMHGEYWRVNKIVDYDTSSDVHQTTKMELVKLLRAQTNTLIDYIQGGYLGIGGGTGGSTTTTGTISTGGTTPSVVQMGPAGTVGQFVSTMPSQLNVLNNSIVQDANGMIPTFFSKQPNMYTNIQDLKNVVYDISNNLNALKEVTNSAPIGKSIILTEEDAGRPYGVSEDIQQLYFKNINRRVLFMITLQDMASDGFTIAFSPYTGEDIAFVQILNENVNTHEIFVINVDHGITAKYDATRNIWNIQTN